MAQQYFDFTNDLIFRWVMEREENCLAILRAILPELKITAVKRRENEHPVDYLAFDDERGVRFDAIIEDDRERFYDVEMQVANQLGLGKRVRYYQSQIDQETLKKSEHYDALRESYVIFFCAFDPCGQDRRLYQFHLLRGYGPAVAPADQLARDSDQCLGHQGPNHPRVGSGPGRHEPPAR